MAQSFLEQLQDRKQSVLRLAEKAAEYGWIPVLKDRGQNVISLQEIKDKIENDTLVIGVIGQMKCGKSTFLNAFVFEDDILPAATTPMTAALSIITWGEKARLVAEFYTPDEWEEQKYQASRSLDDVNDDLDESKVKAAKDLVSRASKLGNALEALLGKTQEDVLSKLEEYVGADGQYVSITKAVTIYYPKEYLKGVEIVDTPGFNDPIVSREERTKEFLKKADVVLMMLYAGRAFDDTDRSILFKNVRQCGIGKVLIGINKYDIPFCAEPPEGESQIKEYVIEEIRKACRKCNDNTLNDILRDTDPIPLSAEMALLSQIPMTKISASDIYSEAWKRHCKNFGISTQAEMRNHSHLDDLANAIRSVVYQEKEKILFAKPINAIFAAGEKKKTEMEKELCLSKENIDLLLLPDNDLDEREEDVSKANRRISKKIDTLGDDIESELRQVTRKGKYELEDIVDASFNKMTSIIQDSWPAYKSFDCVWPSIEAELNDLSTRKLKRATLDIAEQGKKKISTSANQFFSDAEDILMRFVPEFNSREFIKSIQNQIKMDIEEGDLFSIDSTDNVDTDESYGILDYVTEIIDAASLGSFMALGNLLTHSQEVSEKISFLNKVKANFDPQPYLESAFRNKEDVINTIKQKFITELLEPLQTQISEIREKKDSKASELEKQRERISTLENDLSTITEQIAEMERMKD